MLLQKHSLKEFPSTAFIYEPLAKLRALSHSRSSCRSKGWVGFLPKSHQPLFPFLVLHTNRRALGPDEDRSMGGPLLVWLLQLSPRPAIPYDSFRLHAQMASFLPQTQTAVPITTEGRLRFAFGTLFWQGRPPPGFPLHKHRRSSSEAVSDTLPYAAPSRRGIHGRNRGRGDPPSMRGGGV